MKEFLANTFLGNTFLDYLLVVAGMFFIWILLNLTRHKLIAGIKKITSNTKSILDDFAVEITERFFIPYCYLLVNYYILQSLNLSERTDRVISAALMFITGYYLVRLINFLFHKAIHLYMKKKGEPENRIRQTEGMLLIVKAVIWLMGIIMLADNLGYNITTIIAGLGVGGIAIALAAQSILGDLFSYIVIFFDKPFEIGDYIVVGTYGGVVEKIGIKTSHVRSLDGQQLIVPNSEISKSVIQNYKRLDRRRIVFSIGVVYYTPSIKLRNIPGMISNIIATQENAQLDRVHFKSFGDFSINYEIVYYINSADYVLYMSTQQSICLTIFEIFEKENIEFAFPTQTIFMAGKETSLVNADKYQQITS